MAPPTCGAASTATTAPASAATVRRCRSCVSTRPPGSCAGPQRIFHDGEQLRFVLDGDGCRVELEIVDEGDAVLCQRTDVQRDGRDGRHHLLQQLPRLLPSPRARWSSTASRARGRRAGLAGPLVGRAPLGQLRLQSQLRWLARHGRRRPAVPLRIHGRRQRQLLPARLARASRRAVAGGRAPPCWCTSTTTRCAVPPPRSATPLEDGGDDHRPHRHHRRDDRCHGTALRLGVGGRRQRRRRARRLGLPRDEPQRAQRRQPTRRSSWPML